MEIKKKVIPTYTIGKMKPGDTFECEGNFYQVCYLDLPGKNQILDGKVPCYNFTTFTAVMMSPGIFGNPVKLLLEEQ